MLNQPKAVKLQQLKTPCTVHVFPFIHCHKLLSQQNVGTSLNVVDAQVLCDFPASSDDTEDFDSISAVIRCLLTTTVSS